MASILALLDSLQHRTTPPSAPCDYSSLRRAVVLVGHDDLVGLPVDYHSAPAFVNSPVRIAPCTAASYSTARQGDRPVRFFAAEELGIMACASVIQVAPPTSTIMLVLLLVTFVSRTLPHEAHEITELVHAELLGTCSRQRARVVDALEENRSQGA